MGTVSSTNTAVSNLLQNLSAVNCPVLSSPSVVSALEKAPPSDIVQLSTAALQLQGVDAMFGLPQTSDTSSSGMSSMFPSLATATPSSSASSSATPSAQSIEQSMADEQLQSVDEMFGMPTSSDTDINNLLAGVTTPAATNTQTSSGTAATLPPADQLAANQASLQAAETQALFGVGDSSDPQLSIAG